MAWTEIARRQYRRDGRHYASGLSGTESERFGLNRTGYRPTLLPEKKPVLMTPRRKRSPATP